MKKNRLDSEDDDVDYLKIEDLPTTQTNTGTISVGDRRGLPDCPGNT